MAQKVWLITGIGRGLGRALAKAALARGDLVIGTTRRGEQPTGLAADELTILPLEMTDRDQIAHTAAGAFARHGRLDVIVNNAGYGLLGSIEASTPAEVDRVFAVNFFGPLALIRAALPRLRAQRCGHIVNISSIAGVAPTPGAGLYAATKSALDGMSYSLAQEVAPFGIWVTVVNPGAFRTEFLSNRSVLRTSRSIDDYAGTSGRAVDGLLTKDGRQLGDPDRGATALMEAVESDEPPLNLVLGSDALDRARGRLDRFEEDLIRWESLTLSTDFTTQTGATR
ncbi:oxidoreductase [Bradyrhizobium sp. Pha-3]|uniref:oxidoreductase n=1 Tax=Bradyrhizobium sp. Pha-3 TaxID=208375 RepID=UPI0035D495EA